MSVGILLTLCVCAAIVGVRADEVPRPRGVDLPRAALYEPSGPNRDQFVCLDGLKTIKYTEINDDYCDCADASDEPGTAACPHGHFHCVNAGHRPLRLPSSRINDGVCDCCDASDEWASTAAGHCYNDCDERGREDRVREKKRAELARLGTQLKADMAVKGRARKAEQAQRLDELKRSHAEAQSLVDEREAIQREATSAEQEAVDAFRAVQAALRADEPDRDVAASTLPSDREVEDAFKQFDTNGDGRVEIGELTAHTAFDWDEDEAVRDAQAQQMLGGLQSVDWETFAAEAWPVVRDQLLKVAEGKRLNEQMRQRQQEYEAEQRYEAVERDVEFDEHEEDEQHARHERELDEAAAAAEGDDEEEEEEYEEAETGEGAVEPVEQQPLEPVEEYDADTQRLVEQAREARDLHAAAERELRQINSEIAGIEQQLDKDYGVDEEFAALHGECFSYEDREYVYKVCPFDRAVQQSRGGGAETRLGGWERWAGPPDDPYATMLFSGGAACWNGPQRSATVHLVCGLETKLLTVAEPNRCEYVCTMQTPSACTINDDGAEQGAAVDGHDEL